jgi:hypothetical protein
VAYTIAALSLGYKSLALQLVSPISSIRSIQLSNTLSPLSLAMSAPITFVLPDLVASIPFPLRINPHCKAIGDESDQWIFSYGIYTPEEQEAFKRGKYGLLGAMCWPYAEPQYLRDCDDFGSYLFAFDDLTDSGSLVGNISGTRTAADIMMNVLYHPDAPVHSTLAHMLRE